MKGIAALLLFFAGVSHAEVTRIDVQSTTSFAGGKSFGAAGPYVRIIGRFYGELDPTHPGNKDIVDLRLAPRNARGNVEYSADFEVLRPADAMKGNGTLLYEVNNRGRKLILRNFGQAEDDGFLMRRGFSLAWSGWIPGMPKAQDVLGIEVPGAQGIEAPVWDEFLFNSAQQASAQLTFSAASTDKSKARLMVREKNEEAPKRLPASGWEFADARTIRLLPAGSTFRPGALYQFGYATKNPPVAGIGFAATRDFVAFLRYSVKDSAGTANPLGPNGRHKVSHAIAQGTSQSGRFLRDMLYQGFNETEDLRPVFDGMNPHVASARIFLNFRAAQPNRAYSMGYGFVGYPDTAFPFAYEKLRDDFSRHEDGLLERCRARTNCPKIVQTVSSTEYWQGGHSLSTTDTLGAKDLALPENVRIYHLAGTQHSVRQIMPKGICSAPANTGVDPRPILRALLLALDRWVKEGKPPPPSVYPRLDDRTLVPAESLKWPARPDGSSFISAPRSPNFMPQFDYGFNIAEGVIDNAPPAMLPYRYKVRVPAIDADGNEIAGLRVPEQAVPLATTTGWALRSAEAGAAGELCYLDGSSFPFARTAEERAEKKDPRPSLAERYKDKADYVARVRAAAQALEKQGYLLTEDVERITERAARAW